ncbi:mast cell protease 3-like isoform X1 [Parambassis ranga]|uniref:Mast cell protease 3-like isoform X1 n=1 Tax=Parambassis ranga TaxID=210632 RepID=A0A6P7HT74_9TELE|nr:mast cell protease 3-like isoform X1 [Parambassis ranga]
MAITLLLLLCFVISAADGSRIVGGRESAPHSRPYMASLQSRGSHFCGGALVRADFVVTAAHCPTPDRVVLGAHSLRDNEQTKQVFRVVRAFRHPDYNMLLNDIKLLKLDRSAQLTPAVQTIPIGPGTPITGRQCLTAGWGYIDNNRKSPDKLQEIDVFIINQRTCQTRWPFLAQSMICAMPTGAFRGFCNGDSGGPLVCDGGVAGVVSFSGRICGDSTTPDVYTRVSSFRDWITRVLNSN